MSFRTFFQILVWIMVKKVKIWKEEQLKGFYCSGFTFKKIGSKMSILNPMYPEMAKLSNHLSNAETILSLTSAVLLVVLL